jgi:hypothetical protein
MRKRFPLTYWKVEEKSAQALQIDLLCPECERILFWPGAAAGTEDSQSNSGSSEL